MSLTAPRSILVAAVAALLVVPGSGLQTSARDQGPMKPPQGQEQPQAPSQPESPQPAQQNPPSQKPPEYTLQVQVPVVNVDVVVTDNNGTFISGLHQQNFRIYDDGVLQSISNFAPTDAPITIVILLEYSSISYGLFSYRGAYWADEFLRQLKPQDWVALVDYDLKPHIDVDFTQNKMAIEQGLYSLGYPGFHEANMMDAIIDTVNRLQDVQGKKAVLLIATGLDTFSKHTLDDALKLLKQTDVSVFCVGVGRDWIEQSDAFGELSTDARMSFLQADNEMTAFAKMTGGYAWFPKFEGELPGIFEQVAGALRNQYTMGYTPSNQAHDGKYHKIKVEVVGSDGKPLVVLNQKGKKVKYYVYAREGYIAPKGAIGD